MSGLRSYGKVYAIGHRYLNDLFRGEVVVQEKIDGSQFSAGVVNGELYLRSRRTTLYLNGVDKLFEKAVQAFTRRFEEGLLQEGWTYRGEAVCKPKHNTLAYERAPDEGVILFDIDKGEENYVEPEDLESYAFDLDLECVPELFRGTIDNAEAIRHLMESKSCLGGPIEGVVVKNYNRFGIDGRALMGKLVSEQFKEVNKSDFRKRNPSKGDVVERLKDKYRTEARWRKAVERLRDAGELEHDPRDIGALIKEVQSDLLEECEYEIKQDLFDGFRKEIVSASTRGLPEFYKQLLLESAFDQ